MRHWLVSYAAVLLVSTCSPLVAASQTFNYATIDVPGALQAQVRGVNDRSQIVGWFLDAAGYHGFLRSNGVFTTIDVPGAASTQAYGINNKGQIVGSYSGDQGVQGFVLDNGRFTSIVAPGGNRTEALAINDAGQIVGQYGGALFSRSFLWTHGRFVDIDFENAVDEQVRGINRFAQIVGTYDYDVAGAILPRPGSFRLEPDGTAATLPTGLTIPAANGINDRGAIVGRYSGGVLSGFLLAFGRFTTIAVPGAIRTEAFNINNRGQIIGRYSDQQDVEHQFLATPSDVVEDVTDRPSPNGARVPRVSVIVDGDLTTWTIGPGQEILHDGIQAAGAYGLAILWYRRHIYVRGDDNNWWTWTGTTWSFFGPHDPSS